jgi:hypothetical protein
MNTIILITIVAVGFQAVASAQDDRAGEGQTSATRLSASVADPFQSLLDKARVAHAEWVSKDDDLEAALDSPNLCAGIARGAIKETLDAKRAEILSWTDYYSHHLQYDRDRARIASTAANMRAPQRTDLVNAIEMETREKEDLERRIGDLQAALDGKDEPAKASVGGWRKFGERAGAPSAPVEIADSNALNSLREMAAAKDLWIQKVRRALEKFDAAGQDLTERRNLAMKRVADVQTLLGSLRIESTLYENVYAGMAHRLDLRCDLAAPDAAQWQDEDWLKRTGERIKK